MSTTPAPERPAARDGGSGPLSGGTLFALAAAVTFFLTMWLGFVVVLAGTPDAAGPAEGTGQDAAGGLTFVATELVFDPVSAEAPAGTVTLRLENQGAIFHDLRIDEVPSFVLEADPGVTDEATVDLEPGAYTLYCSVPGHRDAGMEATLTVGN